MCLYSVFFHLIWCMIGPLKLKQLHLRRFTLGWSGTQCIWWVWCLEVTFQYEGFKHFHTFAQKTSCYWGGKNVFPHLAQTEHVLKLNLVRPHQQISHTVRPLHLNPFSRILLSDRMAGDNPPWWTLTTVA